MASVPRLPYGPPTLAVLATGGYEVSSRIVMKVCSVALIGLIAYGALGPANWQLRPMLGWKTEHFLGFLIVTFVACIAWPRPLIVGLALMATAGLLEALQGLTPDRVPDFTKHSVVLAGRCLHLWQPKHS